MNARPRTSTWILAVFTAVVTVLFSVQQYGRLTHQFADLLSDERVAPFGSLAKLVPQLLGCVYAALSVRHHAKGGAARPAWILLSACQGAWFVGQVILATYYFVWHISPVPSAADPIFTLGSVLLFIALTKFASVYRATGFAVGSMREHMTIALGVGAVLAVLGSWLLVPRALAAAPLAERIVDIGYPVLDLAALIPAVVLLRITIRFRGGEVWRVWGALLAGIVFLTGADIVFSDSTAAYVDKMGPIADLLFILGYAFCAYGARLQYELVRSSDDRVLT